MPQKTKQIQRNDLVDFPDNLPDFICPVPIDAPITQVFGARPAFYGPLGFLGHPGIDFAVLVGTDIRSSNWGLVLEIGNQPKGWGKYIKIQHGHIITLYAHLSAVLVSDDCYVTRGQVIARSGNTGLSSGPHLHWGALNPGHYNNGYKGYFDPAVILKTTKATMEEKLKKITAEIAQIKKDQYDSKSLYIHVRYIEQILEGTK